jgi:hypothetical protein
MKKLILFIVSGMLLLSSGAMAEEIYLNCVFTRNANTQISLSYNTDNKTGKQYVGQGLFIPYDLELSNSDITLIRKYEGKFVQSWNINRYNGNASFYRAESTAPAIYFCTKVNQKF